MEEVNCKRRINLMKNELNKMIEKNYYDLNKKEILEYSKALDKVVLQYYMRYKNKNSR
ncbi:MAG: Spo0E family sporulation regulatory protein-aspartic acid phosphatase [Clostridia bacterium]|nr:Spo0E family sporulation regulatory protein-aspartic acid phosphatase [Clostridia bacterium]